MSRRLNVLHVHSGNLYGGIESILVTLARQPDDQMEHTFALCFQERLSNELRDTNANVQLMAPVRLSRPWTLRRARARLREALSSSQFDVAICHSAWSRAAFGPVLRKTGLRTVIWQHSAGERQHWLDRWSRRVPTELAVCNSHFTARLQTQREPEVGTAVVYPPVPPPPPIEDRSAVRREVRQELQIPDEAAIILQVGRLEPGKGHLLHLEAAAAILDLPDWILVQVGGAQWVEEHAYRTEIEKTIRHLGLAERVRLVGERNDVGRFYAAADIYCQPNMLPESFGITFIEALYAGLPVIATAIGAAPEIVDEECGLLVPRENAAALASALRMFLNDKGARTKLGQNGPDRAAELCEPARSVTRLQNILSEIIR